MKAFITALLLTVSTVFSDELLSGFDADQPVVTLRRLQKAVELYESNPTAASKLFQLSDCPLGYAYLSAMDADNEHLESARHWFDKCLASGQLLKRYPCSIIRATPSGKFPPSGVFEAIRFSLEDIYRDSLDGRLPTDLSLSSLMPFPLFTKHAVSAIPAFGIRFGTFDDTRGNYLKSIWLSEILRNNAPNHIHPLGKALTKLKTQVKTLSGSNLGNDAHSRFIRAWDRWDAVMLVPEIFMGELQHQDLIDARRQALEIKLAALSRAGEQIAVRQFQKQRVMTVSLMAQIARRSAEAHGSDINIEQCSALCSAAVDSSVLELLEK